MATFRCGRFPTGEVPIRTVAGIVLFRDGSATVDDPELVAALLEVPDVFEITLVEGSEVHGSGPTTPPAPEEPPAPGKRPPQSAPKTEWVDWATAHGMDRDQAEDLTKAELIKLADELDKE